jgi:hypothetical protein
LLPIQSDKPRIMIANKLSMAAKANHIAAVAVAASALFGASQAWADPEIQSAPLGVYVGVAGGFAPSHRVCEGNSPDACDRLTFGNKLTAGWHAYNDVAIEVNYLYFNGVNRDFGTNPSNPTAPSRQRVSARALTAGIDWHVALLHDITNHIRVGAARYQKTTQSALSNGTSVNSDVYKTVPYLGAGLSYTVNDYFRIESAFDYLFAGHDSRHLLSIGAYADF